MTLPPSLPPDTNPHRAHMRLAGRGYTPDLAYPDTLRPPARRYGIPLPYSCNAGSRGSCAVRCVRGQVWTNYNEVLTYSKTCQGLVLACTGYPVGAATRGWKHSLTPLLNYAGLAGLRP